MFGQKGDEGARGFPGPPGPIGLQVSPTVMMFHQKHYDNRRQIMEVFNCAFIFSPIYKLYSSVITKLF